MKKYLIIFLGLFLVVGSISVFAGENDVSQTMTISSDEATLLSNVSDEDLDNVEGNKIILDDAISGSFIIVDAQNPGGTSVTTTQSINILKYNGKTSIQTDDGNVYYDTNGDGTVSLDEIAIQVQQKTGCDAVTALNEAEFILGYFNQ